MAINFPNSPVNGNTYKYNEVTYIYSKNGIDEGYWKVALPQVSGIASPAEVNAGVDAVKYISPATLTQSELGLGILTAPNSNKYKVTVSNLGVLEVTLQP